MENAAALLSATLSPNAGERDSATATLAHYLAASPGPYLLALSQLLASPGAASHLRNAAGLAIKNALSARESARQEEYAQRWKSLDISTRDGLKQQAIQTLADGDRNARSVSAQLIAAIAAIEIPAALWATLIPTLLQLVGSPDNPGLRQATLKTIGYICETIVSLYPLPADGG